MGGEPIRFRSLLPGAGAVAVAQGVNLVVPVLIYPYLIRTLGAGNFGKFAFVQACLTYATLATDYGFNLSAARHVIAARGSRSDLSRIFWNVQAGRLLLAALASAGMLALGGLAPRLGGNRAVSYSAIPALLGALLLPQWLFQSLERQWLTTACVLVGRVTLITATLGLVRSSEDTALATLVQSLSVIASGIAAVALLRLRGLIEWVTPTVRETWGFLSEGRDVFLSLAATTLYSASNVIVLALVAPSAVVGTFAALDKIRQTCQGVLTPVTTAAYPLVTRLLEENRAKALGLVRKVFTAQMLLAIGMATGLMATARPVAEAVLGPNASDRAIDALRVMSMTPVAIGVSNVLGVQLMLPLGLKRQFMRILAGAGLLNIALLLALGTLKRELGAAMALLITEGAIAVVMGISLRRHRAREGWE